MTRSSNPRMPLTLAAATALMLGLGGHATAQQPVVHHKTVKVGELDIFYREAGPKDAPAILLLQGFPTSSQMFRNLIPALADRYRVVAPDYVQDYGAPVGYRLAVAHPERVTAIVVQNGNAYD
jgi:pimeloyl-ACP methyl ester carboxylesterase